MFIGCHSCFNHSYLFADAFPFAFRFVFVFWFSRHALLLGKPAYFMVLLFQLIILYAGWQWKSTGAVLFIFASICRFICTLEQINLI